MMKYVIFLLPLVAAQTSTFRRTGNVRQAINNPAPAATKTLSPLPNITPSFDVTNEAGRFALAADLEFSDFSGYFFNAMIITAVLLLIANLMGVTLFPNITTFLEATGVTLRDRITALQGGRTGARSLDIDTLNTMANMVDQAIAAYESFQ